MQLKREYPDANDASVLMERDVQYDYLIQVMDAIRTRGAERLRRSDGASAPVRQPAARSSCSRSRGGRGADDGAVLASERAQ